MESVKPNPDFWRGKRVFMTGHTGFKGGWLSLWLQSMGAEVHGYALNPLSSPNIFTTCNIGRGMAHSTIADVRDADNLRHAAQVARPEIVFHLAAQPLVRDSYARPVETYAVNVMGTVHLLEAVRATPGIRAVVNITTDKCYENREWMWGYRETESIGGFDPYSSSKGCSELITSAYRRSFLAPTGVALASARAGNVIGGGDWAKDRLVPDILRAIERGDPVRIRNPHSVRPWQHVLEPLAGYLRLAEALAGTDGARFAEPWNFGPSDADARPVHWIVERMLRQWGNGARWIVDESEQPHEATCLKLDCSKARAMLGWEPQWSLTNAVSAIVDWHKAQLAGDDMRRVTLAQIDEYQRTPTAQ